MGASLVKDYDAARSLYITENIPQNSGSTRKFNQMEGQTFASYKAEGADASKASVVMGYNVTMTKRRFAKEIDITYEARMENRHTEVVAALTNLSTFCYQRMAIDLTHRITFATATSYTDMDGATVATVVGDGLALVSAVHTLSGSSTTYSNVITGNPVFSKGAFQVARGLANTQIYTNFGERRIMEFNTIITGDDPTTVDAVKTLVQSNTDPTQNNPGVINTYSGDFKHVILPRLATTATGAYDSTKVKYWAYAAIGGNITTSWNAFVGIWEEPNLKVPTETNNGSDPHNDNMVFGCRAGWGIATVDSRGFMLSTGLGS